MRTGWNINTTLEFKKSDIKGKIFDFKIIYSCAQNPDSHMEINVPGISNKDLFQIRDEISKLIGE